MVSIKLNPAELTALRQVDERLMSYNVEMTEVTGGTFWKAYTPRPDRRHRGVPSHSQREGDGQPDAVV